MKKKSKLFQLFYILFSILLLSFSFSHSIQFCGKTSHTYVMVGETKKKLIILQESYLIDFSQNIAINSTTYRFWDQLFNYSKHVVLKYIHVNKNWCVLLVYAIHIHIFIYATVILRIYTHIYIYTWCPRRIYAHFNIVLHTHILYYNRAAGGNERMYIQSSQIKVSV